MKEELNIAAILKEKPLYTKLWSPLYGDVFLKRIETTTNGIRVLCKGLDGSFGTDEKSFWKNGKYTLAGEVCLFPSKQMLDWEKFAWKKGDVLRFSDILVIFEKWSKDDYTEFKAAYEFNCHSNSFGKGNDYYTAEFCKAIDETANNFVKKIKEHYGGKLNLETLEIEPKKYDFKPFDKVLVRDIKDEVWSPNFFSNYGREGDEYKYGCISGGTLVTYCKYCIPYNDQTAHLLGTTNEWEGGEV